MPTIPQGSKQTKCECGQWIGVTPDIMSVRCYNCGRVLETEGWEVSKAKEAPDRVPKRHKKGNPGTELQKLVSWFAKEDSGCKCKQRAAIMDAWGVKVTKTRRNQVVGWLMQEGERRGWPGGRMVEKAAGMLVDKAIKNAEKELEKSQDAHANDSK